MFPKMSLYPLHLSSYVFRDDNMIADCIVKLGYAKALIDFSLQLKPRDVN